MIPFCTHPALSRILLLGGLLVSLTACQTPPQEICGDNQDNDGNGLADCADLNVCGEDPTCLESGNCGDSIDNNLDGLLDCESPECQTDPDCSSAIFNACSVPPFVQPNGTALGNNGAGSDLLAGSCTGGNGASEFIFLTGSGTNAVINATLTPDPNDDADLGLYIRQFCGLADSELGCADDGGPGLSEVLRNIPIPAGLSVAIIVDGADADQVGAFTLSLTIQ